METSAVYWEPKIKTYGFQEVHNLSMLKLQINAEHFIKLGEYIDKLDDNSTNFFLTLVQYLENSRLHFCLVLNNNCLEKVLSHIKTQLSSCDYEYLQILSSVDLLYFHGPHYGDRCGIAFSAFNILARNHISVVAAGCSGSSIYIVLPEKEAEKTKSLLLNVFEIP